MAITNPARHAAHRHHARALGPQLTFAAAVLVSLASLMISTTVLPRELALTVSTTLLLGAAALVALFAWSRGYPRAQSAVTYWDVAGALTLIGLFTAALVEPDHMVRLVAGARDE
jgi:hypothetical protein